jgi:RNA polymerase sigma-70 factor (ECF subfamily)
MTANKPPSPEDDRLTDWACQHGPAVRGYLRALLRHPDEADDLTQDVFRRAWRARDRYREQGTARAYLLRIADRLARDHARQNRREVNLNSESWETVEPADTTQDPAERMLQTETQRQLAAALDSLSPTQRRVLLLRYYGQLSFAEIAATIPCPLGTALSHCRRGLLALREMFAETLS